MGPKLRKKGPQGPGEALGVIFPLFCIIFVLFLNPLGGPGGALGPPPIFPFLGCCAVLRCGEHLRCNLHWFLHTSLLYLTNPSFGFISGKASACKLV